MEQYNILLRSILTVQNFFGGKRVFFWIEAYIIFFLQMSKPLPVIRNRTTNGEENIVLLLSTASDFYNL